MNTKVLVSLALLVGIGAVLHTVEPPTLFRNETRYDVNNDVFGNPVCFLA